MTTVFISGNRTNVSSAGTHVFIVGAGEYPCLLGGDPARLLDKPLGLGQLSSPPLSAVALADWFVGCQAPGMQVDERVGFHNPLAPLASVEMLVSPSLTYHCPDGTTATVDAATRDNIDAYYGPWLERAKSHPDNIAVFYFCGHGVAGSSDYILPSDFGTHRKNPWSDAIDITETARAARREVGGSLYFFIDACRQASRDSLMPGASPPALQYVDFDRKVLCFTRMLLWATGEGAPAFSAKGQVSRFAAALIEALSGFYGEELSGTGAWAVTGEALAKSVRTILDANNASLNYLMHQHVEQQLIGSQVLHYETREPKAVGRVVSTWSANSLVRELAQDGAEALGKGALEALAEQLEQRNVQIDEFAREIEEWARRYRELEQRLANEPDSELAQQARSYLAEGKLEEAGTLLDELIKAAETRLAAERVLLASHYLSRAEVYKLQFKPHEALTFFRNAYELFPDEPIYAIAYASMLQTQKEHRPAETIYTSVLSVLRARAVTNPCSYLPTVAMTLNRLGSLYCDTRRLSEAETACLEALDIRRRLAEANPSAYGPDVAATLNGLVLLYHRAGRLTEAETACKEALDIRRKLAVVGSSADLLHVADRLNNLGSLYSQSGRLTEAERAFLEALAIYRTLAQTNPSRYRALVVMVVNNLGIVYARAGRLTEAETVYQEALDIRKKLAEAYPSAVPDVAGSLNNLGSLYSQSGRLTEAETVYQEALDIYRTLAQANPSRYRALVAMVVNNLGIVYARAGRLTEAETAFKEALDIYREMAVVDSSTGLPNVASSLDNLGSLYSQSGRLTEAETVYQEALDIRKKLAEAYPSAVPDVAGTLNKIGLLYLRSGRVTEAEGAYLEALDLYRTLAQANPSRHQSLVAMVVNNLGSLYRSAGRLTEAETAYKGALDIYRRLAEVNPSVYQHHVVTALDNLQRLSAAKN